VAVVDPGPGVLDFVRSSEARLLITAPYIKSHALRTLIAAIPDCVCEFTCITRWLPEDIASGVCDIEIYEDIAARAGALRVHPHLHAKYFSNTRTALVGSANVTGRALGWNTPSNVELLVSLPADFPGLREWERSLLDSSVKATADLRDRILAEADELKRSRAFTPPPEVEQDDESRVDLWVPTCTVPDRLWLIYQGRGAGSTVASAFEAAKSDLAALSPPRGLSEELFEAYIAGILRQMPFFAEIDRLASTGMTDSQAHNFLAERLGERVESPEHVWRVLKAWLMHFFPDSYRLETGQDVLVKGKVIPPR